MVSDLGNISSMSFFTMINQSADAVYVQSFTGIHAVIFFNVIILLRDKVGVTSEQLFGLKTSYSTAVDVVNRSLFGICYYSSPSASRNDPS